MQFTGGYGFDRRLHCLPDSSRVARTSTEPPAPSASRRASIPGHHTLFARCVLSDCRQCADSSAGRGRAQPRFFAAAAPAPVQMGRDEMSGSCVNRHIKYSCLEVSCIARPHTKAFHAFTNLSDRRGPRMSSTDVAVGHISQHDAGGAVVRAARTCAWNRFRTRARPGPARFCCASPRWASAAATCTRTRMRASATRCWNSR